MAAGFPCSAYTVNAFLEDWITSWQMKNWKGSDNKEVKNRDLWETLLSLTKVHEVTFFKVKGHSDNEFNNRCDELARGEIKIIQKELAKSAID